MTKAVGYTRLSQDSDTSIQRQKRGIRDYCERNNFDLDEIHDDGEFSSGFDVSRSEYQTVRNRVEGGEIDAVVIYDHGARIGRDFDERMKFLLSLREHGVELHSDKRGHIDLSNPTDVAVEGIHAAKDDEAKREEIEKSKEAVEERLENGYDHGRPPFGLEFDEDGRYWVPGDDFEDVLDIFRLRNQGMTYEEISEEVGVPTSTAARVEARREMYYERQDHAKTGTESAY